MAWLRTTDETSDRTKNSRLEHGALWLVEEMRQSIALYSFESLVACIFVDFCRHRFAACLLTSPTKSETVGWTAHFHTGACNKCVKQTRQTQCHLIVCWFLRSDLYEPACVTFIRSSVNRHEDYIIRSTSTVYDTSEPLPLSIVEQCRLWLERGHRVGSSLGSHDGDFGAYELYVCTYDTLGYQLSYDTIRTMLLAWVWSVLLCNMLRLRHYF